MVNRFTFVGMFIRKRRNKSGTVSVVVEDKSSGKFRKATNIITSMYMGCRTGCLRLLLVDERVLLNGPSFPA